MAISKMAKETQFIKPVDDSQKYLIAIKKKLHQTNEIKKQTFCCITSAIRNYYIVTKNEEIKFLHKAKNEKTFHLSSYADLIYIFF